MSTALPKTGPKRRIAVSGIVIFTLLAFAACYTIWRYQFALEQSDKAQEARSNSVQAERATTHFWREREAMNEYFLAGTGDLAGVARKHRNFLHEVESEHTAFANATQSMVLDSAEERRLSRLANSANDSFVSTFRRNREAPLGAGDVGRLLQKLNGGEDKVLRPLESLVRVNANEVRADQASTTSANRETLIAALLGGALGLAAVLAFVLHALRLVERLESSEQRLKVVLDTMSDGLIVADVNGNFVIFNEAAERILGKGGMDGGASQWQSHYGIFLSDGVTPAPKEALPLARAMEGETVDRTELVVRNADRPEGDFIEIAATPLQDNGRQAGAVAIFRDITERKRTEHAVKRAREEAEEANQAKTEFLSRMSHELRTPLSAILGFAQLLEMDELEARQHESVEHILMGGRHLLGLINELLEVSRIEARGEKALSLEPVHLATGLASAIDLVQPLAAERRIRIEKQLPEDYDRYVIADEQRLKQVLLNLLSNAVKYNRTGGSVTVGVEETSADRLTVLVADTGNGIPANLLEKLFDPFERLGAEQSSTVGTGLGLTLAKVLVEAMGGTLRVESELGVGTIFRVELALTERPALEQIDTTAQPSATAAGPLESATLLLIEDNLSNLQLVERILSGRTDVNLLGAIDGDLGLDLARHHRPDLVLLDLHLPGLTGEAVLERLKADPRTHDVPVVVMTADTTEPRMRRLLGAGAHGYVTKPLDVPRFLEVVEGVLSESVRNRRTGASASLEKSASRSD